MAIAIKVGYRSPGGAGCRRQPKGIYPVISGVVNTAASHNAGIPFPCATHQLVRATAGINYISGIAIVGVQTSVTSCTGYPDYGIIGAVRRSNPSRAQTCLAHAPGRSYGRWICGCNLISRNGVVFGMKNKICSLAGVVGGSRLAPDGGRKVF